MMMIMMYDVRCTVYELHDDDRNEHLCAVASLSSENVLPPVSKTGLPNPFDENSGVDCRGAKTIKCLRFVVSHEIYYGE